MKHLARLLVLLLITLITLPAFADYGAFISLPNDLEEIEAEAFKDTKYTPFFCFPIFIKLAIVPLRIQKLDTL